MINIHDIEAARERIKGLLLRTPVLPDPTGHGLYIKAEHLQRTGSFKLRGASNRVTVAVQEGAKHVVTGSSGNHGQAVACVAQQLGIRATVVVPEDAAAVKVAGIRSFGATVEFCGLTSTERLARAEQIVREQGAVFIPPYDDPYVQAGQGTIGLEILDQVPDVERVYVPVGGGGLISGIATAIKESRPSVKVIGVEPALASDTYQSLQKGAIVDIGVTTTIADGLRTSHPGSLTFPIIQRYVDEVVLVSEEEIREAFRYMFFERHQLVEPSGAVSVAAALRAGGKAVAVVSGGNVDRAALPGLLGL
ncbi:MAG: threonine ammonia-lyase [Mycobacterium leprae]